MKNQKGNKSSRAKTNQIKTKKEADILKSKEVDIDEVLSDIRSEKQANNKKTETNSIKKDEAISQSNNKPIPVTNHAVERYVERIIGIESKAEIKTEAQANYAKYENAIREIFKGATLVYTGCIGTKKYDCDYGYYINDTTCIIRADNGPILTLYPIDFDLPGSTNKTVMKSLLKEIEKVKNKVHTQEVVREKLVEDMRNKKYLIGTEIKMLEAKIEELKLQQHDMEAEVNKVDVVLNSINQELAHRVAQLVHSKYLFTDMNNKFN